MRVEVEMLGPFSVRIDGAAKPDTAWSRRDAASLVKVLALTEGRQLHREQVIDLEAVVDAPGLDTFPLLGISQGAAVAVTYAARHPERVTRAMAIQNAAFIDVHEGRLLARRSPGAGSSRWRAATTSCWTTSPPGRSSSRRSRPSWPRADPGAQANSASP